MKNFYEDHDIENFGKDFSYALYRLNKILFLFSIVFLIAVASFIYFQ